MTSLNTYTKVVHPRLMEYGFKSNTFTKAEQKKIDNLGTEAAHYLLKSFQQLDRADTALMHPSGQGIDNVLWLINEFTRENAENFYNILVILVASKLINTQTCEIFRKNLSDLADEQVKAFLKLMEVVVVEDSYGVRRITKAHFRPLLNICEHEAKQLLPELSKLIGLLQSFDGAYFGVNEYTRIMNLNNIQIIQNLNQNILYLSSYKVGLYNMLGGKSVLQILLTDNGNSHALIALETKLIDSLARRKLLTEDNIHALFLSLIAYDGSSQQARCLENALSFIIKEGNAKKLTERKLIKELNVLSDKIPGRFNRDLNWNILNQLAAQVLGQIEPNNGVSLRR